MVYRIWTRFTARAPRLMRKAAGLSLLIAVSTVAAYGQGPGNRPSPSPLPSPLPLPLPLPLPPLPLAPLPPPPPSHVAPEIDPSAIVGALALLGTGVAMLVDRRGR
jgi:hypothetical protein